jgi:septum site-determining protein MinD
MIKLCEQMRHEFDYVLIDSPAGIEQGFQNAVAGADQVVVVTTPEVSAVRDADRIIGLIEAQEKGPGHLIINRLKPEMVRRGDMLSTDDVVEILAIELLGIIPEDETIVISTNRGTPVVLDGRGPAAEALDNIARRLIGEDIPVYKPAREQGFFSRLTRFVRGSE